MTRGKQGNASKARRLIVAEDDIKAYKRENADQKRRIAVLEREVAHTHGLQERCDTLTMELELATGPEVRRLNAMVGDLTEKVRVAQLQRSMSRKLLFRCYELIVPGEGHKSVESWLQALTLVLGPDAMGFEDIGAEELPFVVGGVHHAKKLGVERSRTLMRARGQI